MASVIDNHNSIGPDYTPGEETFSSMDSCSVTLYPSPHLGVHIHLFRTKTNSVSYALDEALPTVGRK